VFNVNGIDTQLPSPVEKVNWPNTLNSAHLLNADKLKQLRIYTKRDDLIHNTLSGNKWRKLLPFVKKIQQDKIQHIVSFGGGYSNHLHALAYLCATLKVNFTAVVRGDYSNNLSPTLLDIQQWGARLKFVSKIEYKERTNLRYCDKLCQQLQADLIIPEGGSHCEGINGLKTLVAEYTSQLPEVTHVILPVASGGTLAGIVANSQNRPQCNIIGIAALKGQGYLEDLVHSLLPSLRHQANWHIEHGFHHGGYAKSSESLKFFIQQFETASHIPLEPVYSGKCFYAVDQMIQQDYFPPQSVILVVHTGGLQGLRKP